MSLTLRIAMLLVRNSMLILYIILMQKGCDVKTSIIVTLVNIIIWFGTYIIERYRDKYKR